MSGFPSIHRRSVSLRSTVLPLVLFGCFVAQLQGGASLHDQIDQLIGAGQPSFEAKAAPPAGDGEFLRRAWLDFAGTIPSTAETRAFLEDQTPDKRVHLIDRLLTSPSYARHFQDVLDVMLMERRPDKHVPHAQWQEFLRSSLAGNKPWDQLVRDLLSADGVDPKTRQAAKFLLDRESDPNLLTRDVARLFLGMNLQCAQCHDHPLVEDYKQDFYYGIFAFLNRSFVFTAAGKPAVIAEKAEGDVSYQSVFDPTKTTKFAGPHLPGMPPVSEPKFDKGKEYAVAPGKNVRPVPKFSRRAQLAAQVTCQQETAFRRTIVNRLWALMMGRGLIHPVELDHNGNPPSHPELLNLLAQEFANRKFDLRYFLRELALTKTYQRSSVLPAGIPEAPPASYRVALLKPLTPEQLAWGMMQAVGLTDSERRALGKNGSDAAVYARLAGNVQPFIGLFGSTPGQPEGQDFQATLNQALFLENGGLVRGWLNPRPGNLIDRLLHPAKASAAPEELYLSILTRPPTVEERQETLNYLKDRTHDQTAAYQELAWALLASAEFRFNH
jgi:hypothetical protein